MNKFPVNVHPLLPLIPLVIVLLPLFVFFLYKEIQRSQKFLVLRITALSLMLCSLLGVLLRPFFYHESKSGGVMLLTKGYPKRKVDSILNLNANLRVAQTKDADPFLQATVLKSWYDLDGEKISYVAGQGVPHDALDYLPKTFQYIPASPPQGIVQLTLPDEVYVHHRHHLQGVCNAAEKMKLKLLGPGGAEDSLFVDKGAIAFSLSFTPKQAGSFIYSLVGEAHGEIKSIGRVPINAIPERQLRILFLQNFPTADVRFLKNFLSGKGHQLAVRYRVSKSNFTYEYANMPRQRFDPLGSELLDSFDLAFIDQKTYDELSAHERADFKRSIQNGLGVICLLHDPQEKMLGEFLKVTTKKSSLDTVHMHFTSSHNYVLPVLPIELNPDASILPVVQSKTRILSGYFFVGQGKMGFQFIQETFRLGMAGNASDYAFAWTDLLQKTARTQETPFQLKLTTPFPYYPDEPLDTNVTSFGEDFALHADGVRVPLEENIFVDDSWNGRTWAGKSGWHQLHIKHDATQLNYFVSEAGEWTSLMLANQMRENQVSQAPAITQQRIIVPAPVPMLLFYLIFVFASAFLWLAPKI